MRVTYTREIRSQTIEVKRTYDIRCTKCAKARQRTFGGAYITRDSAHRGPNELTEAVSKLETKAERLRETFVCGPCEDAARGLTYFVVADLMPGDILIVGLSVFRVIKAHAKSISTEFYMGVLDPWSGQVKLKIQRSDYLIGTTRIDSLSHGIIRDGKHIFGVLPYGSPEAQS